ncbi:hypothetical protein ACO0QE_001817 [Hanseniaspora vineae]
MNSGNSINKISNSTEKSSGNSTTNGNSISMNNNTNPKRHSILSNLALYSGMEESTDDIDDIDDMI